MLPLQGARVRYLAGELRSHKLHGVAEKTKTKQKTNIALYSLTALVLPPKCDLGQDTKHPWGSLSSSVQDAKKHCYEVDKS